MTKSDYSYLLFALVALSVFDLNGYLSAVLFFLIAGVLWLIAKRPQTMIPPVAFVIVAYTLGFPVVLLWPDLYPTIWLRVSPDALEYAMLWSVRGFGAFALGYFLVDHFGQQKKHQVFRKKNPDKNRIHYTLYILTSIGWLAILSWIVSATFFGVSLTFIEGDSVGDNTVAGSSLQVLTLLSSLRYPFFFVFLLLHYGKQTDRHLKFLFVVLLFISIIEIIVIGSKASIIRGVVVVLLSLAFLPIKLNFKQVMAGGIALITVYGSFSVITEYRSIMNDKLFSGDDVFDFSVQIESFGAAVVASLSFSDSASDRRTKVGQEDILSRFGAGMFSFANLMQFTGRQPPYENAWKSFLVPVYSIVPRTLLPEKPEFFHSGRNAREYYGWSYGGISVSLLGSLYFAWGYAGIIFGMAFLGGLLAYVVRQASLSNYYSSHWLILLVIVIVAMLNIGGTFHSLTTNVIRITVLLWLLHVLYPVAPNFMRRSVRTVAPLRRRSI